MLANLKRGGNGFRSGNQGTGTLGFALTNGWEYSRREVLRGASSIQIIYGILTGLFQPEVQFLLGFFLDEIKSFLRSFFTQITFLPFSAQ